MFSIIKRKFKYLYCLSVCRLIEFINLNSNIIPMYIAKINMWWFKSLFFLTGWFSILRHMPFNIIKIIEIFDILYPAAVSTKQIYFKLVKSLLLENFLWKIFSERLYCRKFLNFYINLSFFRASSKTIDNMSTE